MSKDLMKVSFTKDCIADALEKLMEHRALKDISVDEITALAGVGRATYFRNFNSKYEVCAYKQIKEQVYAKLEQLDKEAQDYAEKAAALEVEKQELVIRNQVIDETIRNYGDSSQEIADQSKEEMMKAIDERFGGSQRTGSAVCAAPE